MKKTFTDSLGWTYEHNKIALNKTRSYLDLLECYNKPSNNKINAFKECEKHKQALNGKVSGIHSFNCNFFTYTFTFEKEGKFYRAFITASHNYYYEV